MTRYPCLQKRHRRRVYLVARSSIQPERRRRFVPSVESYLTMGFMIGNTVEMQKPEKRFVKGA